MATSTQRVGLLVRQARQSANLTQEKLAAKVKGVSDEDISLLERGEIDLTNAQLKLLAKALGITQTSLLSAPKNIKAAAKKTAAKKTTTAAKKTSAKKTTAEATLRLSAAEKKLVLAYREADADARKKALDVLSGAEQGGELAEKLQSILGELIK